MALGESVLEEVNYNIYTKIENSAINNLYNIALLYEDKKITYGELLEKIEEIASYLSDNKIKKGTRVGVLLEKGFDFIYSVLTIFKMGAVYIPINPEYPAVRKKFIIENANVEKVIGNINTTEGIDFSEIECDLINIAECNESTHKVNTAFINKNDIAYIFYTSGSTGNPKGAMLKHEGLVNRILWQTDYFNITNNHKVMFKAPIGFDISLWEFLVPLQAGATMIISKENGYKDIDYIISLIEKYNINIIQFVPSLLRIFINKIENSKEVFKQNEMQIVSSGEEISLQLIEKFYNTLPKSKLFNFYGPTETTICVTAKKLTKDDTFVSIGKPINSKVNVFLRDDNDNDIIVNGKKGEICISGICVGEGYVNLIEQTENAFKKEGSDTVYYTGDIGVYKSDELLYVGRKDRTVKVNGNRVDLGEIEIVINQLQYIDISVVKTEKRNNGISLINAFYKRAKGQNGTEELREKLRNDLNDLLPDYMVPNYFIEKDEFVLTGNGKIDLSQLKRDDKAAGDTEIFVKSENDEIIERLFEKTFGKEIAKDADFFELGGSSIEAIEIIEKVNQKYNTNISFLDMVSSFSINKIYERI